MCRNVSVLGRDGSAHQKNSLHTCNPLDLIQSRLHDEWEGIEGAERGSVKRITRNREQDTPLNILIFGGQFIRTWDVECLPWMQGRLPFLLRIVIDPFLKFALFILVEEGALPFHYRIMKEHARVLLVFFFGNEWGKLVVDFLFIPTVP